MTEPRPFDDTQWTLDGLTVDSAGDRIAIFGSVDLTADAQGLAKARQLAAYLAATVAHLEQAQSQGDLPEQETPLPTTRAPNPFG